ncbi:MAG: DUF3467 domain-containing protein [bacterium]
MANEQRTAPQGQPVPVEIGEKESEGIYSNLVLIAHSPSEFIFDFARMLPGLPKARVYARIVMTPQHAQMLQNVLKDNLTKFEERFGKINIQGREDPTRSLGF